MASSGSVFSQTLQGITTTKLDELSKRRSRFEKQFNTTINDFQRLQQDPAEALQALIRGTRACFSLPAKGRVSRYTSNPSNGRLEVDLNNIDRFLAQARYDPSISVDVLKGWQRLLLDHLNLQHRSYQYASLYGQLTMEWLSNTRKPPPAEDNEDTTMSESYEKIDAGAKLESRRKWEEMVFVPKDVDKNVIWDMLKGLFADPESDSKQIAKALTAVRRKVREFERDMALPDQFNDVILIRTINGLLNSDLLTDDKRAVLRDFKDNSVILSEIADVLNMRITALQSWSWGDGVSIEQRRQVNGTYNIYMHEDLLDAILLQYIGVNWSVTFKKSFTAFRQTKGVWKSSRNSVPKADLKRRLYFLGEPRREPTVQAERRRAYRMHYFLSRLLDYEGQELLGEEGEVEAEAPSAQPRATQYQQMVQSSHGANPFAPQSAPVPVQSAGLFGGRTLQTARKRCPTNVGTPRARKMVRPSVTDGSSDDDDDEERDDVEYEPQSMSPMQTQQNLLHLLSTDIQIKTRLEGEITCFRSQFESLYPSMPHGTVQAVFAFFGVSDKWLLFFQKFLKAPLKFVDDDEASPSRFRKRGTPGSHVLSEVFGEVTLFCLDYLVNQTTDGEILWRMHDAFWFWSSNRSTCVKAWSAITKFADIFALNLNQSKTGCAHILGPKKQDMPTQEPSHDQALPAGQIRWGMLYLNPESGRFEIDQENVEHHISELRRQLSDKSNSIFSWIQTWNTFAATFFTSNFGNPANCYGRRHVDSMLTTLERIQRQVFSSADGVEASSNSVAQYLKTTIEERFGVSNIPDGYLYFPFDLGGLELRSPFIGLVQIRDSIVQEPAQLLDKFEEAERGAYRSAKAGFEKHGGWTSDPLSKPEDGDTFFSFEEYSKYREDLPYSFKDNLASIHALLMKQPEKDALEIESPSRVLNALSSLERQPNLKSIVGVYAKMDPYWQWVTQLYGPEMLDRFGGFNIVDPGLLPMGMVNLFRSGRVQWQ